MRSDLVKGVLATTLGMGLVAGVIVAGPAIAQDTLPEGPGKAETVAGCSGCHGLGQLMGERRSADMWATTVTSMINNGAPVSDADFEKVVAYLAANFGDGSAAPAAPAAPVPGVMPAPGVVPAAPGVMPAPVTPGVMPAPVAPPAAAAAAPTDGMPEGPGKAETVAGCSGCHGLGQLMGEHRSAEMWATTVTSMINNGAPVADADFDKVVGYLAAHFGDGPAPAQ